MAERQNVLRRLQIQVQAGKFQYRGDRVRAMKRASIVVPAGEGE